MTNLSIHQGDDYSAVVTVTDGTGAPANLTGYTARAQIRRTVADDSDIVYAMQTQITGADITLSIPHTVTETLTGRYRWDLELVSSSDVVSTLLNGSVVVTQEVTRITI